MFGPGTTAGKIDDYESRFTIVNGAHFLIAPNRREAWPISAAEAEEYKALYRRRMMRARLIRRLAIALPILLLLLNAWFSPLPEWLKPIAQQAAGLLFVLGMPLGFLQHPVTSDLTKVGIERRLKHRITTRSPEAIKPALTPLGRFARRLLFTCIALELGMTVLHGVLGKASLAEHMRVMTGLRDGQEGLLAQVTGALTWGVHFGLILAFVLLVIDRRARRLAAEREEAVVARDLVREKMLQRLAAEAAGEAALAATAVPRSPSVSR